MRTEKGNSGKFALQLKKYLDRDAEIVELKRYLQDPESLVRELEDTDTIVLCTPLYVDGLPSQVIRLLETFERTCSGGPKKIYLLANMGLYESRQLRNLFGAVRQWCGRMNYDYCGGLGISAGEMIGALIGTVPFGKGPLRQTAEGMQKLAEAVSKGDRMEDLYAEPTHFPRFLYISITSINMILTCSRRTFLTMSKSSMTSETVSSKNSFSVIVLFSLISLVYFAQIARSAGDRSFSSRPRKTRSMKRRLSDL